MIRLKPLEKTGWYAPYYENGNQVDHFFARMTKNGSITVYWTAQKPYLMKGGFPNAETAEQFILKALDAICYDYE